MIDSKQSLRNTLHLIKLKDGFDKFSFNLKFILVFFEIQLVFYA